MIIMEMEIPPLDIQKKIGFNNIPTTHLDESGAELYHEQPF